MTATDTTEQLEPKARELPHLDYTGDPTHGLRVPELRVANAQLSRTLGRQVDVLDAITRPTADRWDAMAYVAWVIHKRTDPTAQLGIWTGATAGELSNALQVRETPQPAVQEDDPDAQVPTLDQLGEEARQDPTETTD
jgi:hypothetical protein